LNGTETESGKKRTAADVTRKTEVKAPAAA